MAGICSCSLADDNKIVHSVFNNIFGAVHERPRASQTPLHRFYSIPTSFAHSHSHLYPARSWGDCLSLYSFHQLQDHFRGSHQRSRSRIQPLIQRLYNGNLPKVRYRGRLQELRYIHSGKETVLLGLLPAGGLQLLRLRTVQRRAVEPKEQVKPQYHHRYMSF